MKNICNNWTPDSYPYINFSPDAKFSEENRAWQGCPSVAITKKGRLFSAWLTGGEFEPCICNYNVLVKSDDNGKSWSAPILTVGADEENRLRKIDIELWTDKDNSLWAMWIVSPYTEKSTPATIKTPFEYDYQREFPYTEVMVCRNPDDEQLIWEKPRKLCDGFMRNKPINTLSGKIIAPAYDYNGEQYKLRYSENNGESFHTVTVEGKPDVNMFDEIAVCERRAGELRFLARTKRGYYVYSDSFDDGNTWSDAKEYEKAPCSRCYYGRLKSGMIAYVRNLSDAKRCGMKICLSEDGGDTFPYEMVLDDRENASYPDLAEDENGNLYIVYDRERDNRIKLNRETWLSEAAKEILICRISVDDVKSNTLSEGSFLQKVISKAKIDTVRK